MNTLFRKLATSISKVAGTPLAFLVALTLIIAWAITGPLFHFSDTWQLVINTGTTIITFLMVFLIQNTQNRDAKAMQLKLDELIKASKTARDDLIDLENLADEELDQLEEDFQRVHEHHRSRIMHILREQVREENRRRNKRVTK